MKPKPGDLPPINHMQHVENLTKLYSAPDSFPEVNFGDHADNVPVSSENLPEIESMTLDEVMSELDERLKEQAL